jgi:flagellar P-ring protein precursor FlgI
MSSCKTVTLCFLALTLGQPLTVLAQTARIKDVVEIKGVRENSLQGVGLVIGLSATGDSPASVATKDALATMLGKFGHPYAPAQLAGGAVALVSVTGQLKTFMQNGDRFDVQLASLGDAKSLVGGTLMMTLLRAADGQVYGTAGGRVLTSSDSSPKAVQTSAVLPNGGVVEREFRPELEREGQIVLSLRQPDFTTAMNVADAINAKLSGLFAKAADPSRVDVIVPEPYAGRLVEFIAELEQLAIITDLKAVIVLNERTGTVVAGGDVRIFPVSIAHGKMAIQVGGDTVNLRDDKRKGEEQSTTVSALAAGVTAFGMGPRDLIAILHALKASGAIQADIKSL